MNGFEKRTEEKKKSVLESAFALMNNDAGVKNLTIDDLVKEANVGKTTIFKYFGSKENIIHEVFIHFLNEMGDSAKAIMAQNGFKRNGRLSKSYYGTEQTI
ncbi:TetR/AcrR family transcriptional regulator [Listeria fleischmannii]|uniref:TetR/AcrR family transcriptional regulator n=1 Tax=Listeria fleischmannii TaxID=1069827 RepID=UPI000310B266|nr:TetR/AcrR family transcriptional regulator [Listeria fleischmannii]